MAFRPGAFRGPSRRLGIPEPVFAEPRDVGTPNVYQRMRDLQMMFRNQIIFWAETNTWSSIRKPTKKAKDAWDQYMHLHYVFGNAPHGGIRQEQLLTREAHEKGAKLREQRTPETRVREFLRQYVENWKTAHAPALPQNWYGE